MLYPCPTVLKQLSEQDLDSLAEIHLNAMGPDRTWSRQAFTEFLNAQPTDKTKVLGFGLSSPQKEELLGFILTRTVLNLCTININHMDRHFGESEILTFAINPQWQGQGFGKQLLEHAIAHLAHPIFLEVAVDNPTAIGLYKKYGFEVTGLRKNYYGNVDAHVMVKQD